MTYDINIQASIGGKLFRRVASAEIERGRRLDATCVLEVPATARLTRQGEYATEVETAKVFAPGDEVVFSAGYNGDLYEEFRGYVRRVHPNVPVRVECDNEVYLLRRKNCLMSWRTVSLEEIVRYVLRDTGISLTGEVPDVQFKGFYLRNVSAATALEKLREEYGLTMYFPSWKHLAIGLATDTDDVAIRYVLGENTISHNLEYSDERDVLLRVKAVHVRPDNTQEEKIVGDHEGELRTIFLYDLERPGDLERLALEELQKYRYTGFRGDIETFLVPRVHPGNVAQMDDSQFEDRNGRYLVEEVKTSISTSGARRTVKIGIRV